MEAKVGFMQRLRNKLGGTPKEAPAPNAAPVQPAAQAAPVIEPTPVAAAPEPVLSPAEMGPGPGEVPLFRPLACQQDRRQGREEEWKDLSERIARRGRPVRSGRL